jgi:hypothetical protein
MWPIFWSVSARQLARVGAKTRSKGVAEVYHQRFYLLASSCTYGAPPTRVGFEIIPRFFGTGMYYTEIEITTDELRLQRTILYPPRDDSYEQW